MPTASPSRMSATTRLRVSSIARPSSRSWTAWRADSSRSSMTNVDGANRAICAAAAAAGDACVDLYHPFLGADGSRNPTPLLAGDGDHPNDAGHALIARTLLAATPALHAG